MATKVKNLTIPIWKLMLMWDDNTDKIYGIRERRIIDVDYVCGLGYLVTYHDKSEEVFDYHATVSVQTYSSRFITHLLS